MPFFKELGKYEIFNNYFFSFYTEMFFFNNRFEESK